MKSSLSCSLLSLGAICCALCVTSPSHAGAGNTGVQRVHAPVLNNRAAQADAYFVEFVARPTEFFGHTFVRLGTTSRKGERSSAIAGLYPDPKRAKSVFNDAGIVGYTASDLHERPSARYRVAVSKQTYDQTKRYLGDLPKTRHRYDLFGENCNHLVAEVAEKLGLKVAGEPNDLPDNNIRAMQTLNGGRARASWRGKSLKSRG